MDAKVCELLGDSIASFAVIAKLPVALRKEAGRAVIAGTPQVCEALRLCADVTTIGPARYRRSRNHEVKAAQATATVAGPGGPGDGRLMTPAISVFIGFIAIATVIVAPHILDFLARVS